MNGCDTYPNDEAAFSDALAHRLKQLRLSRGLTQEQVANATGMALYTVQKLEKGKTPKGTPLNPRSFTLLRLANLYGITLNKLFEF